MGQEKDGSLGRGMRKVRHTHTHTRANAPHTHSHIAQDLDGIRVEGDGIKKKKE